MQIARKTDSRRGQPLGADHFTGAASALAVHRAGPPQAVNVSVVRFEAGVRNHWHRHSGGQVLHVVEGECLVQSRGGPVERVEPGDTVAAAPDEEHWHGASAGGPMAHLAVSIGEVAWAEPAE